MLDALFLNVHRRYLDTEPTHGGFLGIYLLAAFVRQEGYAAKSFSGSLEAGLKIVDEMCGAGAVGVIGLYCDFENVTENIFLSRRVKEIYKLPVIVGGPQATALGADFFISSRCDAVVRYEGELTVLALLNFFLEGVGALPEILGVAYFDGQELRRTPERPLIRNLDALPFIDEGCYVEPEHFYRGLSLMTGRGCPFRCAFCHEGAHTKMVRLRSVENVLAEIDAYLKKWDGDNELYILFTDDTFTLSTERVEKICAGLAERRRNHAFKFFCEGHVHTLYKNPAMIEALAKAGCVRIQLGIEAGTAPVLKAYGKNTTPAEIFEVVRRCRDAGIQQVYGNIILGGANFTRETFEADRKFTRELILEGRGVVELGVVTYWPLPETRMTRCPAEFGIKICDAEFVTAVGDFPQIETPELDRLAIAEMERELRAEISALMLEMLEGWQVPTARILNWFPKARRQKFQGMWFMELARHEILFAYYEMLALGEGITLAQVEDLPAAHPMRVAPLSKHLRRIDAATAEFFGEIFSGAELEVLLLTAGKLSVAEISARAGLTIAQVVAVLQRLERRHLVVFAPH